MCLMTSLAVLLSNRIQNSACFNLLPDESPDIADIPFAPGLKEKHRPCMRVIFEIVNARIIKEGRNKHVVSI